MARIIPEMPTRGAAKSLLSVVDNYYSPARDVMGENAIAKGFGDVSNLLGVQAQKARKAELTEISLQAQQDALVGDDPDVELSNVRMGGLFRGNSKVYNQAYNETMGKKAAIDFQNLAALDYEKSGMKHNTDPSKFREWMNTRVDGFLKAPESQNPYFLAGAMPYVEQATHNMSAAHTSNISSQLERNHIAAIQTQADDVALKVAKGEMPMKTAILQIADLNNQGYATGLDGPKVRKALISSFLSVADATDNKAMIDGLLEAQNIGILRLTPDEWNNITKQGEAISRDIASREIQLARASKAQTDAEVLFFEDTIADFYNNPANAGVSFSQLLQVVGEDGMTLAQKINKSPNTAELMKKTKDAYETVNAIYDIPEVQAQNNNLAITDAINNGQITDSSSFLAWRQNAQKDGLRLNDDNVKHAYAELEKLNDPERPYSTQIYKDYKKSTENRLINAMTPDGDKLFKDFYGSYQGTMADDIRIRFQTSLDEHLAAIPPNKQKDPKLIKAAIADAENDVMEFYKEVDPNLYQKQFTSFNDAVNKGEISWSANPHFAANAQRLVEEQRVAIAEQTRILNLNRANAAATALRLEEANKLLFGEDGAENIETPELTLDADAQSAVDAANNLVLERAEAERIRLAEIENRKRMKAEDEKDLIYYSGRQIERMNDEDFDTLTDADFTKYLNKIQSRFNLTVPTNYDELGFLTEDLIAFQDLAGVKLSIPFAEKLLEMAMKTINENR